MSIYTNTMTYNQENKVCARIYNNTKPTLPIPLYIAP